MMSFPAFLVSFFLNFSFLLVAFLCIYFLLWLLFHFISFSPLLPFLLLLSFPLHPFLLSQVCQCPLCKKTFQKRPDLQINRTLREITEQFRSMRGGGGGGKVGREKKGLRGGGGGGDGGLPNNLLNELKKKLHRPLPNPRTTLTCDSQFQGKTEWCVSLCSGVNLVAILAFFVNFRRKMIIITIRESYKVIHTR